MSKAELIDALTTLAERIRGDNPGVAAVLWTLAAAVQGGDSWVFLLARTAQGVAAAMEYAGGLARLDRRN